MSDASDARTRVSGLALYEGFSLVLNPKKHDMRHSRHLGGR